MMPESAEQTIAIDYYTDLLCVWAWIAQPRLREVCNQWGEKVSIRHRYIDIFGDAHNKIRQRWGESDGFEKFSEHIHHAAEAHPDSAVHRDIWLYTRPHTSLNAHLFIKAAGILSGEALAAEYALDVRRAFFVEARDISDATVLLEMATAIGIDSDRLQHVFDSGEALAALSGDMHHARQSQVSGSPTWVLNEGRQVLYGNVGYRILSANIEELLRTDSGGASWC
jgi:predicted DsbA family dithiol-disulfide isomerase